MAIKRFLNQYHNTKTKVITFADICPITTDVKENTTNQSQLEAKTSNPRNARENACNQLWLVLVWLPTGWENGAKMANQSQRAVKALYCIIFCNTKSEQPHRVGNSHIKITEVF